MRLRIEDFATTNLYPLIGWNRHRRAAFFFEENVGIRVLADFRKNLCDRMIAPLDFVRVFVDENRDDLLVRCNESLQPALSEVDYFLWLDHVVVAVDKFRDQLEGAGPLIDLAEQDLSGRVSRIDANDPAVNSDPVQLGIGHFPAAFGHLADVDFWL